MMNMFRNHPVLSGAFLLASAVALFFAVTSVLHLLAWSGRGHETVAPWMTVGYVARSWDLDPREIDARAGLPQPQGHPFTLTEIALQRGVPVSEIILQVEATVAALVAERGTGND